MTFQIHIKTYSIRILLDFDIIADIKATGNNLKDNQMVCNIYLGNFCHLKTDKNVLWINSYNAFNMFETKQIFLEWNWK